MAMAHRFPVIMLIVAAVMACSDDDENSVPRNAAGVGNHCARDADCPTGTCYLGPGGGYCTVPCSDEGDTAACPVDTVCKPIQGGPARCLLICGSSSTCGETSCGDGYCPTGSSCVSVSDTSARACEPLPG
jgi:hypothetical protein